VRKGKGRPDITEVMFYSGYPNIVYDRERNPLHDKEGNIVYDRERSPVSS
jgi:hypothetical protein